MPGNEDSNIDWNELDKAIDSAIRDAVPKTNATLASRASSLTRMTDAEIQELFPAPADVKKLRDLLKIVKSSEERNNKINRIVANAEEFGGVVLTILQKFV